MTNFAYNVNIPDAPNNPSSDQPLMKTNTNSINSLIAQDHKSFNVNNGGTHKQVTLTNEAAPGIPAGTNGVLYANVAAGQSWPFWQNALGSFRILGNSSIGANGYTTLPGGLIMQWGSISGAPIANNATVSFPITFANLFSITLGPNTNSTNDKTLNIKTGSPSTSGFTVITSGSSSFQTLYWMAVGN